METLSRTRPETREWERPGDIAARAGSFHVRDRNAGARRPARVARCLGARRMPARAPPRSAHRLAHGHHAMAPQTHRTDDTAISATARPAVAFPVRPALAGANRQGPAATRSFDAAHVVVHDIRRRMRPTAAGARLAVLRTTRPQRRQGGFQAAKSAMREGPDPATACRSDAFGAPCAETSAGRAGPFRFPDAIPGAVEPRTSRHGGIAEAADPTVERRQGDRRQPRRQADCTAGTGTTAGDAYGLSGGRRGPPETGTTCWQRAAPSRR